MGLCYSPGSVARGTPPSVQHPSQDKGVETHEHPDGDPDPSPGRIPARDVRVGDAIQMPDGCWRTVGAIAEEVPLGRLFLSLKEGGFSRPFPEDMVYVLRLGVADLEPHTLPDGTPTQCVRCVRCGTVLEDAQVAGHSKRHKAEDDELASAEAAAQAGDLPTPLELLDRFGHVELERRPDTGTGVWFTVSVRDPWVVGCGRSVAHATYHMLRALRPED